MKKILIVDDEPDILEFLKYNLEKEGYKIHTASNGAIALNIAKEIIPDLIILDVMMPEMDGIETCKNIKENQSLQKTLIVFLSARSEDYSQIAGLDSGADDFIIKPVRFRVLLGKINAMFRRTTDELSNKIITNDLIIDKNKYSVIKENKTIDFPKKEFELLFLLASKPNKILSREEIYSIIWGDSIVVGDRTIDVHIKKIRDKLGNDIIRTIKGVGYKFEIF